jgi:acetyltransferase-like isoleucine patch superfamily enzyme
MIRNRLEYLFCTASRGAMSRVRLAAYRLLGLKAGRHNRIEGGGRMRRCSQIHIGSSNAFTQGAWLWPENSDHNGIRIRIGDGNYFNRNVMIDACGLVEIGNQNMFGPDVYITDSNHRFGPGMTPNEHPMDVGTVRIGNRCWVGAKAVILKDVVLGDGCVVGAGSVVTKSVPAGAVVAGVPAKLIRRPLPPQADSQSSSLRSEQEVCDKQAVRR